MKKIFFKPLFPVILIALSLSCASRNKGGSDYVFSPVQGEDEVYGTSFTTNPGIRGKVVDDSNAPMAGVLVKIKGSDTGYEMATETGPDGSFRFDDVLMGDYTVSALVKGSYAVTQNVTTTTNQNKEIIIIIPIVSPNWGTIKGSIKVNSPATDIEVAISVYDKSGTLSAKTNIAVAAGRNGSFSIPSIVPGIYLVKATAPGCKPVEKEVDLKYREVLEIDFILDKIN